MDKKLYVIYGINHKPIFFRAYEMEDALCLYEDGLDSKEYQRNIRKPGFKCEEVTTLEQLLKFAPDPEFTLTDSTLL